MSKTTTQSNQSTQSINELDKLNNQIKSLYAKRKKLYNSACDSIKKNNMDEIKIRAWDEGACLDDEFSEKFISENENDIESNLRNHCVVSFLEQNRMYLLDSACGELAYEKLEKDSTYNSLIKEIDIIEKRILEIKGGNNDNS